MVNGRRVYAARNMHPPTPLRSAKGAIPRSARNDIKRGNDNELRTILKSFPSFKSLFRQPRFPTPLDGRSAR